MSSSKEERLKNLKKFIEEVTGTGQYDLQLVSGDASFRKYYRVNDLIFVDAPPATEKNAEFVEMLVTRPEEDHPNPEEGRTSTSLLSEPSSKKKLSTERDDSESPAEKRPSVRKELEEIRKELNEKTSRDKEPQKSLEHKAPKKKRNTEKARE